MKVVFYRIRDDGIEYDEIAAIEDGEIVYGEDELPSIRSYEIDDPDALINRYDGPRLVASKVSDTDTDQEENTEKSRINLLKEGEWIPYVGPQGGEGWQNISSDEVRYQQDPPGEVVEGHDDDYWKQRWPEIEGSEWEEVVPNPIDMQVDDALLFINQNNQTEIGRFENATFIHNEDWDSAKTGVELQDGREILTDNIEAHADMTLAVKPPDLYGDEEKWGESPGVYTDYVPDNLVHFIDDEGVGQTGVVEGWEKDRGAVKVQTNERFSVVEPNRITHYAETDPFYNEAYNVINSPFKDSQPVDSSEEAPDPNFAERYGATTDNVQAAFQQIFGSHLIDDLEEEIETGDYDPNDPDDMIQAIVNYRGDDSDRAYSKLKHEIRGRAVGMGRNRVNRIISEAFATKINDPIYQIRKRMRNSDANLDNPESWLEHAAQFAYEYDGVSLPALQDAVDDWAGDVPFSVSGNHGFEGDPEEIVALSETGTNTGISAKAMFIADWPNGDRAYITRIRDERENPNTNSQYFESSIEAERAMTGFGVQSALAEGNEKIQIPDHEYRHDTYFSVEGAPESAKLAGLHNPKRDEAVDRDDFLDMAVGAVLAGNKDLHSNNVMVDEGTLYPIDLDLSGYDMTESRNLMNAIDQLVSTANALGITVSDEFKDRGDPDSFDGSRTPLGKEILAHVNDVSSEVAETARGGNPMWGARGVGDNVVRNIEAAKNGELEI